MKKTSIYIFLALLASLPIAAQDLTSVFLNIPDSLLIGLSAEGKDALIKNPADTAKVSTLSVFGGEVARNAISEDYLSLQTSPAGTLQIKLLPLVNDSKIVCMVKTVCGKACDSQVEFYSTAWEPLTDVSLFPVPHADWFVKTDANRNTEDFYNAFVAVDMLPYKIDLSPDKAEALVTLDLENYLSEEDFKKIKPYLNETPKTLTWDKVSFKE